MALGIVGFAGEPRKNSFLELFTHASSSQAYTSTPTLIDDIVLPMFRGMYNSITSLYIVLLDILPHKRGRELYISSKEVSLSTCKSNLPSATVS